MLCAVLTTSTKSDPHFLSYLYNFVDESKHGVTFQEIEAWCTAHQATDRLHSK